jgi:predicted enzyme related to lactoylglutathione lyase
VHIAESNPPGRRNGLGAAGSGNGSDFYIVVTAIDELYEELTGRGAKVLLEPTDWPHGMREFVVEDNNGYRMIFGEPVGGFEHEHDHED